MILVVKNIDVFGNYFKKCLILNYFTYLRYRYASVWKYWNSILCIMYRRVFDLAFRGLNTNQILGMPIKETPRLGVCTMVSMKKYTGTHIIITRKIYTLLTRFFRKNSVVSSPCGWLRFNTKRYHWSL